jgi:hypothetical protein
MPSRQDARTVRANRKHADECLRRMYAKGWRFWTEYRIDGILPLVPGRRFRVIGVSGWFVFKYAGRDLSGADYVEGHGPFSRNSTQTSGSSYSFAVERVRDTERKIYPLGDTPETFADRAERLGLNQAA